MKDFISKATFGFLMAQVFPGAVLLFALGFAYFAIDRRFPETSLLDAADQLLWTWGKATVPQKVFLTVLCIGAGMSIHGLHWATLGALEHRRDPKEGKLMRVFDAKWHQWPIGVQMLLGASLLLWETGILLFRARTISNTAIEDNVFAVDGKGSYAHEFLQDFYLHSAQFFAHTAYALVGAIVAIVTYIALYGYTGRRLAIAVTAYFLASGFFVLARLQLCTLFNAERELVKRGEWKALGNEQP
jgi:hypothetical protein